MYTNLRAFLRIHTFFFHVSLPLHINMAQLFSDTKAVCGAGEREMLFPLCSCTHFPHQSQSSPLWKIQSSLATVTEEPAALLQEGGCMDS